MNTTIRWVSLSMAGAVLTGCGGSGPCLTDINPSAMFRTEFQCPENNFTLTVPDGCEGGGCGVIVDVHGGTMSANTENQGTRLAELGSDAQSYGATTPYIVIQPSSTVGAWSELGADDPSVFDFLQETITKFNADRKRVHMGGFSQGASMTWRFVCDYGDTFASFAPIAGVDPLDQGNIDCPYPKTPILYTNGTSDPLAIYANEAEPLIATVRETIGSSNLEEVTLEEGAKHTHFRLTGNGYFFEHFKHSSAGVVGGHCFPGGGGWLGCSGSFNYGEEALKFYIAHPKP